MSNALVDNLKGQVRNFQVANLEVRDSRGAARSSAVLFNLAILAADSEASNILGMLGFDREFPLAGTSPGTQGLVEPGLSCYLERKPRTLQYCKGRYYCVFLNQQQSMSCPKNIMNSGQNLACHARRRSFDADTNHGDHDDSHGSQSSHAKEPAYNSGKSKTLNPPC